MSENNGNKVEKENLAHWVDLFLKKEFSKSNILAHFKATGIWPLNMERMQQKVKPSTTYYSIPSAQLIEHDIMEDDLPRGASNAKHFVIEEEGEFGVEEGAELKNSANIGQFLKLPQTMV